MPLGTETTISSFNLGDTADLYAYVFTNEREPIKPNDILSVDFVVEDPTGIRDSFVGEVQTDGAGHLAYNDTTAPGVYTAVASFELINGDKRSERIRFQIVDPFDPPAPSGEEVLSDAVWTMLEDCFDSEHGGPWLREATLTYFNHSKIPFFIPFALLEINYTQPITELGLVDFTLEHNGQPNPSLPILAYGTLIQVIHHLMRSYVEQPTPQGADVVYEDRRDYLQRWASILQMLVPDYQRWLILWKRQFLNLGKSALLVHSKAGRLYGPNTVLRTRNVGRGAWY